MEAVTTLLFGYLEPKPGTWPSMLPDAPDITHGSTGEIRYVAVREMPLSTSSHTTRTRLIAESRLTITTEQRAALRDYAQQHNLSVAADPARPGEPAWLWIVTSR